MLIERRRPGRIEYSNPHVIALMRDPTTLDPAAPADVPGPFHDPDTPADDGDGLAPAKGILAGLVLALPLWALIGAGAWLLLRG
jgi:hypothetical protein